jgi:glutamate-1-semialdehyde 2,1-aminomutase
MIPGFTSTGSKRPDALFGNGHDVPRRMVRAKGCRVWAEDGREYLDTTMALGAVSLGYGYPAVEEAATKALADGVVGPLSPLLEELVAERLCALIPGIEGVRFLKTGAEAVAAAVRLARVHTGRDAIVTCGYQGWLDPFSDASGVPATVRHHRREIPFNDVAALETAVEDGDVAAIVVEPVVDGPPSQEWVTALHDARVRSGVVLVLDEIKTGLRLGWGGAGGRYGLRGDLIVLGKALGNGFPIAAVGGDRAIMEAATRTWISSTLATEFVSLAAADAVLRTYEREDVAAHLAARGQQLLEGFDRIAGDHGTVVRSVKGIPEFCYLELADDDLSTRLAAGCASNGLIFKRNAYNFVSLAHSQTVIDDVLQRVGDAVDDLTKATR